MPICLGLSSYIWPFYVWEGKTINLQFAVSLFIVGVLGGIFLFDVEDLTKQTENKQTENSTCVPRPSLLSRLAPVSIDTDGDGRMGYKECQTHRKFIPWVYIAGPFLSASVHTCFPINHMYLPHIHLPSSHPSFLYIHCLHSSLPASIYPSMFYGDSYYHLKAPTNSHSSFQSMHLSACRWNQILACIMTFYTPINFWNVTFQPSIFFPTFIHLSTQILLHGLDVWFLLSSYKKRIPFSWLLIWHDQ